MRNCRAIQDIILTNYIDGLSNEKETAMVNSHLLFCHTCREVLAMARINEHDLNTAPEITAPEHLWSGIRSRIEQKENCKETGFSFTVWLEQLSGTPQRTAWAGFALMLILTIISTPLILSQPTGNSAALSDESAALIALVDYREQAMLGETINLGTNTEYLFQNEGETI